MRSHLSAVGLVVLADQRNPRLVRSTTTADHADCGRTVRDRRRGQARSAAAQAAVVGRTASEIPVAFVALLLAVEPSEAFFRR
jgi:hypothetical protein